MKIIRIIAMVILLLGLVFLMFWAFNPTTAPVWTGFGEYIEKEGIVRSKTLWDWLELIIIPAAIGLFVWVYTEFEKTKNEKIEDEKTKSDILESFFNTVTELLLKTDLNEELNKRRTSIARNRTIVSFGQLDGQRKGQVLQFLYESDLIDKKPMFNLRGADISNAILDKIVLKDSEIKGANFENASLQNANLNEIDLTGSNLNRANLSNSLVENANFSYTDLTNSKLINMDLSSVNFEGAILNNADLSDTTISQSQLDSIFDKNGINLNKANII